MKDDMTRKTKDNIAHAASLLSTTSISASRDRYDLKFIKKYIDKLADYELSDIERKLKREEIKERTGNQVDISTGKVDSTTIRVDLLDPLDKILKQIEKAIGKEYGDVDYNAYKEYISVIKEYYIHHTKGNSYTIARSYYPNRSVVAFLQWIVTGKVITNYAEINKLMEDVGMSSNSIGTFELPGVTVKFFKNGRVDVKFKDSGDALKMQETVEQWTKKWTADRRAGAGSRY